MSATVDEYTSLAIVLSRHFVGLSEGDVAEMLHCRKALKMLERAAQ